MTTSIIRQHRTPMDPHGHHHAVHTLLDVPDIGPVYEVADTLGNVTRHDVWSDTEIADLLEDDDGPFDLWQHDWSAIEPGLLVIHADGQDWYVLPEKWR